MELTGKRILLTGAAGGLGEAAANALAARGATLLLSSRNEAKLQQLASDLPGRGHEVLAIDLTRPDAAEELVARAGTVDVLIANAGQPGGAALVDLASEDLSSVIKVNLEQPIQLARLLIPQMRERGSGQMVFVASLAGKFALPESTLYSATKFGLRGFAWALRPELARHGVGVTLITPGFISEVGMFAKRGRKPPPGAGTRTPEQYAKALVAAIESNKDEVVVAPPMLRALGQFSLLAPGLVAKVLRRARPSRTPSDAPEAPSSPADPSS
ncbi:MAG: SDR family NAD(P)-dependent oxidoreductase [Thermoleophilaceae bacterium]|nr:SDR family NAD(P)-dependent oxidoreductase [Thermoleophilaceae bacterium]